MKKIVFSAVLFFIFLPLVLSAQSYQGLFPLLVKLPGWEAEEPSGTDMSMSGMPAITVKRDYKRRNQRITAGIIVGHQMATGWNPVFQEGFVMQTPDGTIEIKKVGGYLIAHTHDRSDNTGVMIILLEESMESSAAFNFGYNGLNASEALETAKKFDWDRMKKETASIQQPVRN
jgi:hypothetical protein